MSEEADDRLSVLDPVLDAALASRSTRSGVLGAIVDAVTGTPPGRTWPRWPVTCSP